ncbi:gamma-glutamyl kinase [Roseovarius spongiae]|uniref:Gamma-glutamyl kinase n=1 Tax=Roseovarius spongiae TaxID=2320272 RepID=A0A3A8AWS2_9RHOB|nr:gamma-glutamyl kinase [Roseovarius spongiae]RKF15190.1 gamma-glutamyl kinase [Roseovarius spongiae]
MLVFSKQKLVFLSVPKTGTTAWQAALGDKASMIIADPPELKHSPVFRYNRFFRPALEKFIGGNLTVMAVMREPISWLGSWYRYRQRPFLDGRANSTAGIDFDAFVRDYMRGQTPAHANVGAQSKFLEPTRNGTAVTHLFRYEDQAGLLGFLEERLGCRIEVERRNASAAEPLALEPDTEERLRRKFAPDFALWEGIGPAGRYRPIPRASL